MPSIESMQTDFINVLNEWGKSAYLRRKNVTLDTVHGSPESESAPTDTAITIITQPVGFKELQFVESGQIERGDIVGYVKHNVDIRSDDLVIIKNERKTGSTTMAGTSASQAVVSGDVRNIFQIYDYISTSDSKNTGLYKITGVSYSSNTTLTVAFEVNPGTGDTIYKANVFKVIKVLDWADDENIAYIKLILRKLS